MFTAEVRVSLKKGVADPEGMNTRKALELLGFGDLKNVESQKVFMISMDAADEAEARAKAEDMVKRLLANPVIHNYNIMVKEAETPS
jgi:phosphoribosylformylglycinamidine synthase PurS subunit